MGSTSNDGKRSEGILAGDEDMDSKFNKKVKQGELKGLLSSIIADELKVSSRPPSPASFTLEGRKPAEIFRTDLISAMKLPDQQNLNPENYITISDQWRQEWERGVQVPVYPEGVFQPSFRPVEPVYKRAGNFKLPSKLLAFSSKLRSKAASKCPYNMGRMDVEWLACLNKTRHNKGLMELEESTFEQAIAYIENKCYDNMAHAIATQEGLSIEYDEDVCCDVCQSPDSEELNEMVFCDSCDICVHQACYGIQNIPPGSWLCHPCRKGIKSPSCALCSHSGSAMKKSKNGKVWVHVSCALWIPEVGFGNVSKMEPITRIENIPASRWNLVCSLCREKVGACIQCTVKSCVTAFHVTCGFKHGLEMRTVLDDSAADGVRHICYCTRHSHKNKSPSKKSKEENNSSSSEDAENLRQKRLKQMEADFHKFVSVTEIAKDLYLPKELSTRIHKYWTLKRKAQDDIPLLPPTLQQQEKLSGKQGVVNSSSNLQIQLERIVKLRCNLEKLRNLCYMVTKREKMRRELYRAREDVFWKEHEVLTDQSRDLDTEEMSRVLRMCKGNFSVEGGVDTYEKEGRTILPSCSSGVASTSSSSCAPNDRSSSEQDWDRGSGFETDGKRSGGEATKECNNRKSKRSAGTAQAFLLSRRTRRNSHLVSQASSSMKPLHSDEECHVEADREPQNRKRTRSFGEEQKTGTKRQVDAVSPPRAFRTAAARGTKLVEHSEADFTETPRTRRRRRRSPAEVEETRKEQGDGWLPPSGNDASVPNGDGWLPPSGNDASVPNAQTQRPRAEKITKRLGKSKSGNQQDTSQKPRVDNESRKENDPLSPAELSWAPSQSTSPANGRVEASSKRKRANSTDVMGGVNGSKQARITGFLRRRLSLTREEEGVLPKSPKSGRARGRGDCDEIRTEIHVNSAKGVRSPKTFNNGREIVHRGICPSCKLQHDKHSNSKTCLSGKDASHVEGCQDSWSRRELRFRSFQSPKSRARCSQAVSPKPHSCSSLMVKFCPATVT